MRLNLPAKKVKLYKNNNWIDLVSTEIQDSNYYSDKSIIYENNQFKNIITQNYTGDLHIGWIKNISMVYANMEIDVETSLSVWSNNE